MFLISYGEGRKHGGKRQKRTMTPEKVFRVRKFRNWQCNRVTFEFNKTETGSRLKDLIHGQLSELAKLKKEKPIAWEARAEVVVNTIATTRIEYMEELIKFMKQQKGIYKSALALFEEELQKWKAGKAWLVE